MFHTLGLSDKPLFDEYKKFGFIHSQYNFTNLFMWKHVYNASVCVIADMLCIVLNTFGHKSAMFPVGCGDIELAIKGIIDEYGEIEFSALDDDKFKILSDIFPEKLECVDVRNNYDYVYLTEKLITLSGRKLHSKRNHLKRFFENYNYEFKTIDKSNLADCEKIEKAWISEKDFSEKIEKSEYLSTMNVLENFDYLEAMGGIIYIDGKPVAFSIGEKFRDDMMLIHIEKAVSGYEGLFPAINQLCAENVFNDSVYINREEDMGLESLRKAKLSYYPDMMLEYKKARFVR